MESIKYLKILLITSISLCGVAVLENFFQLQNGGLFVGSVELTVEGLCFWLITKKQTQFNSIPPRAIRFLQLFFGSIFLADFSYIFLFYAFHYDYKLWWAVLLTTFLYAIAFLSAALGMLFSFKKSPKELLFRPLTLLPLLLFFPIALRFIIWPYFQIIISNEITTHLVGQGFAIFSSFLAITIGLLVLLSSRGIFWSCFSLGIITLIFGDWALRVETFNGHSPAFGFYEYFWALGILLSGIPILFFYQTIRSIEHFDHRSLLCTYKIGTIALSLVLIVFLSISQYGNISSIKIISFGCSLGAIVATLISHFLTEQVQQFTTQTAQLIGDRLFEKFESGSNRQIPLELIDSFDLILQGKLEELKKQKIQEISAQVAHDIRSPLSALDLITSDLSGLSEERRIIVRGAVRRIKDIANDLLVKNPSPSQNSYTPENINTITVPPQLLSALIDGLITEKRIQYRPKIGVEIDFNLNFKSYGIFSQIHPIEFKRVISNLISNSVEALNDHGKVTITLTGSDGFATLVVRDNGKGIPSELIPKLMRRGETHGKKGGSGLGLFHAKESVEKWKGTLIIESTLGQGTEVTLTLPRTPAPLWFVPSLYIPHRSTVIVLDDDHSIHQVWDQRFEEAKFQENSIEVLHFSNPLEVREWVTKQRQSHHKVLYLFDYELIDQKVDGLAVIEELKLQDHAILVTSRYEEESIRENCRRLGVRLIPKGMAGFVPVMVKQNDLAPREQRTQPLVATPDAILIDDDHLVHMSWNFAAKEVGCRLLGLKTADEFFAIADHIPHTTPIYIDSFLGENTRGQAICGEEVSHEIFKLGFSEIYLSTGMAPKNAPTLTWLKGIRGKDAPFSELCFQKKKAGMENLSTHIIPENYDHIRNYLHDLKKPIQQAVILLRTIEQGNLSEALSILLPIRIELEAFLSRRDEMQLQLGIFLSPELSALEKRMTAAFREARQILLMTPEQLAEGHASGESKSSLARLQMESKALGAATRELLNKIAARS